MTFTQANLGNSGKQSLTFLIIFKSSRMSQQAGKGTGVFIFKKGGQENWKPVNPRYVPTKIVNQSIEQVIC